MCVKVVPALFSYNEHDPYSFQHPENYGASKGHVMGHIVRKGIKYMTGYGRKGKLSKEEYELGKLLVDDIRNQHRKLGMSGGAITDFSDSVKDYIKNKLVEGIKSSSLAIAKYICRDLGISTSHAHRISDVITKFFEAGTGLIVDSKYKYGSGHPKNHKSVKMEGKKRQTHSNMSGKRQQRNELVRKIMREKGLNLPMASRYIKENNLM